MVELAALLEELADGSCSVEGFVTRAGVLLAVVGEPWAEQLLAALVKFATTSGTPPKSLNEIFWDDTG